MDEVKTRFLLKTPTFLGLDYTLDVGLCILALPFFLIVPKYSSIYLILIISTHLVLMKVLKGKSDKYIQNKIRYYLFDYGVWFKFRDKMLNRKLK